NRHVVVCCGTGGVGKTTTAAVFAIEAAKRGRNAVVVTIDPAKRLADTLGVDTLGHAVQEIDRRRWDPDGRAPRAGRLSAVMLDTETTFDGLVVRYAKDEEQVQRILENRFYRNIADAPRARLPRRAQPAHPPARQPGVPAADDADARVPAGRERGGAGVPAARDEGRRCRGRRRRGRVLPRLRGDGTGLPRPGRRGRTAPRRPDDRVRPRHRGPARRRRRGR